MEADHILPRNNGGSDDLSNLQADLFNMNKIEFHTGIVLLEQPLKLKRILVKDNGVALNRPIRKGRTDERHHSPNSAKCGI